MRKEEKEQIQYLLTQYLEGDATKKENELLFELLDKEQDNAEWEAIVEELIASEPEQLNYEREKWEDVAQSILDNSRKEKSEVTKKQDDDINEVDTRVIQISTRRRWVWLTSIAAMLLIIASVWFVLNADSKSIIATEYGQQKKIALPDETEITLNANSNIKYLKRWKDGQPREVWLNGEALFKVKHLNTDSKSIKQEERFIVHTRLANVEVLGTVFNVRERRGKTEIVLEQGKIKVSFTRNNEPAIIMQPGQMITVTAETKKAVANTIKPEDYTAWTKNKLILNNASFEEIIEYMEDNFGKHIILSDPQLANRKVEGTFKIDNLDDALLVLSKALNVEIVQKDDTLIVTPK
jgi:transmembrane sensor